jgi:hypothetical protein
MYIIISLSFFNNRVSEEKLAHNILQIINVLVVKIKRLKNKKINIFLLIKI